MIPPYILGRNMSYYESAEGQLISKARVIIEFDRHSTDEKDRKEFFDAFPDGLTEFDAQELLRFLGY